MIIILQGIPEFVAIYFFMFCHWWSLVVDGWWMGDWVWQMGREDVNRLAKIMHTNIDIPALSTKKIPTKLQMLTFIKP